MGDGVHSLIDMPVAGNPLWRWGQALLLFALCLAALAGLKKLFLNRLTAKDRQAPSPFDTLLVEVLQRSKLFFLAALALYAALMTVTLPPEQAARVQALVIVLGLIQGGLWAGVAVGFVLDHGLKRAPADSADRATLRGPVRFVGRLVIWSAVLVLALDNLGVDITALVAGLGVAGIAVGLALQSILGDLFSSLSIVLDKPFQVGDFIIVNDLMGTVEHIGIKTTRVRALSGEQIVFGNGDLLAARLRNFKRMAERRVLFTIGVVYRTPRRKLETIPSILRDSIEAQSQVRFDRAHFKAYGDFALIFECVYFVLSPDYNTYMDTQQAINFQIHRRFEEERIEFAYPTQTLYVERAAELGAGGTAVDDSLGEGV